jgi:hypothetical protein
MQITMNEEYLLQLSRSTHDCGTHKTLCEHKVSMACAPPCRG